MVFKKKTKKIKLKLEYIHKLIYIINFIYFYKIRILNKKLRGSSVKKSSNLYSLFQIIYKCNLYSLKLLSTQKYYLYFKYYFYNINTTIKKYISFKALTHKYFGRIFSNSNSKLLFFIILDNNKIIKIKYSYFHLNKYCVLIRLIKKQINFLFKENLLIYFKLVLVTNLNKKIILDSEYSHKYFFLFYLLKKYLLNFILSGKFIKGDLRLFYYYYIILIIVSIFRFKKRYLNKNLFIFFKYLSIINKQKELIYLDKNSIDFNGYYYFININIPFLKKRNIYRLFHNLNNLNDSNLLFDFNNYLHMPVRSFIYYKLVNLLFYKGKKKTGFKILKIICFNLKYKLHIDPLFIIYYAIIKASPAIRLKKKKIAGRNHYIPLFLPLQNQIIFGIKLFILSARQRQEYNIIDRLTNELIAIFCNKDSITLKKKNELYLIAMTNKYYTKFL
jgi:small subunit ribosomal protein S7